MRGFVLCCSGQPHLFWLRNRRLCLCLCGSYTHLCSIGACIIVGPLFCELAGPRPRPAASFHFRNRGDSSPCVHVFVCSRTSQTDQQQQKQQQQQQTTDIIIINNINNINNNNNNNNNNVDATDQIPLGVQQATFPICNPSMAGTLSPNARVSGHASTNLRVHSSPSPRPWRAFRRTAWFNPQQQQQQQQHQGLLLQPLSQLTTMTTISSNSNSIYRATTHGGFPFFQ